VDTATGVKGVTHITETADDTAVILCQVQRLSFSMAHQ